MTTTGLDSIERTVHKTNEWLNGVIEETRSNDRKRAYALLRAVLHALRDRLPTGSAVHLGAQLPLLLRGLYYEGWHPRPEGDPHNRVRTLDDFLAVLQKEFPPSMGLDPEDGVRAVFRVIDRHLDPNETEKVVRVLPKAIQALWSAPVEPRDS